MPVGAIAQVVQGLPTFDDPDLLIGAEHFSDAGVYRLDEDTAIVQSVDFIPPIVDDPYTFGRIAAANALGDLYAMGAAPRTALNIVAFPDEELELDVLHRILAGGAERVKAAGAVVLGGHSVRDAEIKYGLAVTGTVHPQRMLTNGSARPGQVLVLTKALGTGFIMTASRSGCGTEEAIASATASMVALNDRASAAALEHGATGATDVTGFGLAGHALEMAMASGVTVRIDLASLPVLPGALDFAAQGVRSRANTTNREHVQGHAQLRGEGPQLEIVFDPQTSGGLLIAVDEDRAAALVAACGAPAAIVGAVQQRGQRALLVG